MYICAAQLHSAHHNSLCIKYAYRTLCARVLVADYRTKFGVAAPEPTDFGRAEEIFQRTVCQKVSIFWAVLLFSMNFEVSINVTAPHNGLLSIIPHTRRPLLA